MIRVAHIGVAVRDLDQAVAAFRDVLGLEDDGRERLDDRQLQTAFMRAGDTHIELIESLSDDTPIAKHIEKRGPGLHHVCFDVDDLDAVLERCQEAGLEVIGGKAEPGAQGKRVAFLHPRTTGGVLIELAGA